MSYYHCELTCPFLPFKQNHDGPDAQEGEAPLSIYEELISRNPINVGAYKRHLQESRRLVRAVHVPSDDIQLSQYLDDRILTGKGGRSREKPDEPMAGNLKRVKVDNEKINWKQYREEQKKKKKKRANAWLYT